MRRCMRAVTLAGTLDRRLGETRLTIAEPDIPKTSAAPKLDILAKNAGGSTTHSNCGTSKGLDQYVTINGDCVAGGTSIRCP